MLRLNPAAKNIIKFIHDKLNVEFEQITESDNLTIGQSDFEHYYNERIKKYNMSHPDFFAYCIMQEAGSLAQFHEIVNDTILSCTIYEVKIRCSDNYYQELQKEKSDKENKIDIVIKPIREKFLSLRDEVIEWDEKGFRWTALTFDKSMPINAFITNPMFTAEYLIEHLDEIEIQNPNDLLIVCRHLKNQIVTFIGFNKGMPDEQIEKLIQQLNHLIDGLNEFLFTGNIIQLHFLNKAQQFSKPGQDIFKDAISYLLQLSCKYPQLASPFIYNAASLCLGNNQLSSAWVLLSSYLEDPEVKLALAEWIIGSNTLDFIPIFGEMDRNQFLTLKYQLCIFLLKDAAALGNEFAITVTRNAAHFLLNKIDEPSHHVSFNKTECAFYSLDTLKKAAKTLISVCEEQKKFLQEQNINLVYLGELIKYIQEILVKEDKLSSLTDLVILLRELMKFISTTIIDSNQFLKDLKNDLRYKMVIPYEFFRYEVDFNNLQIKYFIESAMPEHDSSHQAYLRYINNQKASIETNDTVICTLDKNLKTMTEYCNKLYKDHRPSIHSTNDTNHSSNSNSSNASSFIFAQKKYNNHHQYYTLLTHYYSYFFSRNNSDAFSHHLGACFNLYGMNIVLNKEGMKIHHRLHKNADVNNHFHNYILNHYKYVTIGKINNQYSITFTQHDEIKKFVESVGYSAKALYEKNGVDFGESRERNNFVVI